MREQMGFDTYFDGLYSSATLGIKKPEMSFFQAITNELGVVGGQVMFWDDIQTNIDAAREHGWQAELYTDYARFSEQFWQVTRLEPPAMGA
jgi:putative hydrolase of the HAD superfamily